MTDDPIADLQARLRDFARERDWEQFHNPKNLAMALAAEVGELVEIFQWLTPQQAANVMESERSDDVRDELADVLIYLVRLADVVGVDLPAAADRKVSVNDARYPADLVRGRSDTKD